MGHDRGNMSLESRGEAGWSTQGRDLHVAQEPLRCRSSAHQGWGMWARMDPSWPPPRPCPLSLGEGAVSPRAGGGRTSCQWRISAGGARRSVRVKHRQNRACPQARCRAGRARAASMRSCVQWPACKTLCTGGHLAPGFCRDLVCRQSGWEEAWVWCPGRVVSSPGLGTAQGP